MPEKIAILCSDLHLSDKPPIARSDEPDWYEAMARPLRELRDLAGDLPVLCGGDVFDRWKSPPKLINFAMRELPPFFYSVMGQHDMPYHNWEERESSAFWTLKEGDCLKMLRRAYPHADNDFNSLRDFGNYFDDSLVVRGFHWGEELDSIEDRSKRLKLCVTHKYCWMPGHRDDVLANLQNSFDFHAKMLQGFDVALFGDHHSGFLARSQHGLTVFNAGTFMRRASDEIDYRPMVGILYDDGTVKPHHLDTSQEKMSGDPAVKSAEKMMIDMDGFVEELRNMQDSGLKFQTAIERALEERGAGKSVRRIILEAMEGK